MGDRKGDEGYSLGSHASLGSRHGPAPLLYLVDALRSPGGPEFCSRLEQRDTVVPCDKSGSDSEVGRCAQALQ